MGDSDYPPPPTYTQAIESQPYGMDNKVYPHPQPPTPSTTVTTQPFSSHGAGSSQVHRLTELEKFYRNIGERFANRLHSMVDILTGSYPREVALMMFFSKRQT